MWHEHLVKADTGAIEDHMVLLLLNLYLCDLGADGVLSDFLTAESQGQQQI